jgi:hypothetical protein
VEKIMESLTITQTDISNLADKLDELGAVLTDKENQVLLAVFKLASLEVNRRIQGTGSTGQQTESGASAAPVRAISTAKLSTEFKGTFASVGASSFALSGATTKASGVGIGVVW